MQNGDRHLCGSTIGSSVVGDLAEISLLTVVQSCLLGRQCPSNCFFLKDDYRKHPGSEMKTTGLDGVFLQTGCREGLNDLMVQRVDELDDLTAEEIKPVVTRKKQ